MDMQDQQYADFINATISGPVSGQIAIGHGINQAQVIGAPRPEVTQADLAILRQALADLKLQVATAAPTEKKEAALERIGELEEAVTAKKPDLTTMEYVRGWFVKHLPELAGAVTSIVIHPIVGKLVEAAGDTLAAGLRHGFGGG